MILVQLSRVLVHHLLGQIQGILPLRFGFLFLVLLQAFWLFLSRLGRPQIVDRAFSSYPLIDSERGGEFLMRSGLDVGEQVDREILTVVADEVVGRSLVSHVVDCHLS